MTDELSRRAHSVFVRALDLDGADRDRFVASACAGQISLESRVRKLLDAVPRSSTFLETPALLEQQAVAGSADPASITVRGYRAVRVLGAGGMATVYAAEQEHPRRTVALKVMNRALASTSAVRRFRYETEVLARLRHPGIAQIFESGTCDDGSGKPLPFFAMELVEGAMPITEYADGRGLGLRQRLSMFADVCDAVQHGHQQGVIHRDLKPANVLVDAAGRTKVIDFGIAKSTAPDRADLTASIDARRLLGTLSAMSPEQCSGESSADARSDVYSLGVILYHLVAGRPPHDLSRASIPEAMRIITSKEIPPPSEFAPAARGDLDAIVTKALEKEPERRYASAGALAADIRRSLDDQPIDARPATAIYQIHKFARRNRPLVAACVAVAASLLVGLASTAWMAVVANRARSAAEQRERELEQVAAFQESQLSRIDVQAMGGRLRDALREAASRAGHGAEIEPAVSAINFTSLASRTLDENVLQRSHQAINEQFADQPELQARMLNKLAVTMRSLGLSRAAEAVLAEALTIRRARLGEDHPDTLHTRHAMANLFGDLARYDEAIECLQDVYQRRSRVLGSEHVDTMRTAMSLGGVLRKGGRLDDAEAIWRSTLEVQRRVLGEDSPETLRSLSNMGILHAVRGRHSEAEECWRTVLDRRRLTLPPDHPDIQTCLSNLALLLQDQGRFPEARKLMEDDVIAERHAFGDDHPSTLNSLSNLGLLLFEMSDFGAAETVMRECAERRRRVLGPEHPATLRSTGVLALVIASAGRFEEAEPMLRDVLSQQRRLLGVDHADTVALERSLMRVLSGAGRTAEAEAIVGSRSGKAVTR